MDAQEKAKLNEIMNLLREVDGYLISLRDIRVNLFRGRDL
jgi:hypothetical protein